MDTAAAPCTVAAAAVVDGGVVQAGDDLPRACTGQGIPFVQERTGDLGQGEDREEDHHR